MDLSHPRLCRLLVSILAMAVAVAVAAGVVEADGVTVSECENAGCRTVMDLCRMDQRKIDQC